MKKTLAAVKSSYRWPTVYEDTKRFIDNCHDCRRAKPRHESPAGLLTPLPIPDRPWLDIAMDFVTGLPLCEGMDAVLMVVDRLSKERHYIACKAGDEGTTSEQTAQLMYRHVWKHHGLSDTITSDRGPQFTSAVHKQLCDILGIKAKLSTAFHPQTDGQSEISNAEMERYLRTFVNEYQDNWVSLLPAAEFAVNAAESEATGMSPFQATRGYSPRMSFNADAYKANAPTARERILQGKANVLAHGIEKAWEFCKSNIAAAQQRMITQANKHRRDVTYNVGDSVWLSTKHIKTQRPSKKLDHKWIGPFKVLRKHGISCKLDLPITMKIHDVFHPSLLSLNPDTPLEGQEFAEPPPIRATEGDDEAEWVVDDIIAVRKVNKTIKAQANWHGYPRDLTWYPIDNFRNSMDVLREFYNTHPTAPKPVWMTNPVPEKTPTGPTSML